LSATLSHLRLSEKTRNGVEKQTHALARSAASGSAQYLLTRDFASLEKVLLDIARFPGVTRIALYRPDGNPVLHVVAGHAGSVGSVSYNSSPIPPPAVSRAVEEADANGGPQLVTWEPVKEDDPIGWVALTYSLSGEHETLRELWHESLIGALGIAFFTIAALYWFMSRALRPLQNAARFARQLASRVGQTLDQDSRSEEVAELTDALNGASTRLSAQLMALRVSEAQTQALLQTVPDAIIGLDVEGRIALANPAAAGVFGIPVADLHGKAAEILIPGLSPEKLPKLIEEGIFVGGTETRIARIEMDGLRRDGTRFPLELSLGEVKGDAAIQYTCAMRDLSEQRQSEEFLRLFSRALDCSNNGVVISDMSQTDEPVVHANPAFLRITGYEPMDALGKNCRFLQGNDTDQPEIGKLRQALTEGREVAVTLRNYRKDGSLFWNELSMSPVRNGQDQITHYIGVQTDVTQRIQAEHAIAERSARLDAIFELSPDGFVLFNRQGHLAYTNPAFCDMSGLASKTLGTVKSMRAFDELLRSRCDPSQPYPSTSQEATGIEGVAEILHLVQPARRILARSVRHHDSAHAETILYFRDITHESEVDRMKSEFLSTAAHELRTPMASLFGFTELLLRRKYDETRQRDMLETMHRQAALLINLINELLDLARIESRQGKDFNIAPSPIRELIEETLSALIIKNDPREVEIDAPLIDAHVVVDPEKTRQALTNVLSNAYKYSPRGGAIQLRTRVREFNGRKMYMIEVEDHGLGLTPEQLGRVFERFYRADPSGNIPGTGLGLCLVKEIVELQGGAIEMDSRHGEGTTVRLWLPLVHSQQDSGRADEQVQPLAIS
jgi:PAS domain S-box-containing protein